MNIKNKELGALAVMYSKVDTSVLGVEHLKQCVQFQKVLTSRLTELKDYQFELFKGYKVKPSQGGVYNWSTHKKSSEIDEKVFNLLETNVILTPVNFIPEDKFYEAFKGLPIAELTVLAKYLVQ